MPNIEWQVAQDLVTPARTILLNQVLPSSSADGRVYVVRPETYKLVPSLRVTEENISQADGMVIHPRWKTGIVATMSVSYYLSVSGSYPGEIEPACGKDLREMHENLMGALESIRSLSATGATQRLLWTPTGYGDRRLLDDVVLASWPDPTRDVDSNTVAFSLESPFPYAIDLNQVPHVLAGGTTTALTNSGNTNFFPVIEVTASSAFSLINHSVLDTAGQPYQIVFNASLPGANPVPGPGAEIDTFRGTIFAGGSGADLIAGIDPTLSDFLWLAPGVNNIEVVGTTATFLLNNSWA